MKRRSFSIVVAVSWLLPGAVCALWARSYFRDDTYAWYSDHAARKHWYVASNLGGLVLQYNEGHPGDMLQGFRSRAVSDWERSGLFGDLFNHHRGRVAREFAGFWRHHSPPRPTRGYLIKFWGVPYWFLFALSAPVPLVAAMGWWRRRQRREKGRCPGCGYDLRATPGRCPECGAVPAEAPG